jgi:hypothetical protein
MMQNLYTPAEAFGGTIVIKVDVLIVAGGIYGNLAALEALHVLVREEEARTPGLRVACVLNGDWHWLDADAVTFASVQRLATTPPLICMRGNVETEMAVSSGGCGCNYPANVAIEEVDRSNAIATQLRAAASGSEEFLDLPMTATVEVAGLRVGIVHGDAESLSGWGFAHDALDVPGAGTRVNRWFAEAGVDVFASSHTCLPALRLAPCGGVIVNNGASGMPNFAGSTFGVVTRIARTPAPHVLYGCELRGVQIEALRLDYDSEAFVRQFLRTWPEGSPAYVSYWSRIRDGPQYTIAQAMPKAILLDLTIIFKESPSCRRP